VALGKGDPKIKFWPSKSGFRQWAANPPSAQETLEGKEALEKKLLVF
jgi:hypothetical protein